MTNRNHISLEVLDKLGICDGNARKAFINKYGEGGEVPFKEMLKQLKHPRRKSYLVWLMGRSIPFCRYAVKNGVDINVKDNMGNIPLVCSKSFLEAQKIIKMGGDINVKLERDGRSLLHDAVEENKDILVKFFIDNGADVNARDRYGFTPIFFAVKNKSIFDMLLEAGADTDLRTYSGESLLDRFQSIFDDGVLDFLKIFEKVIDLSS